MPLGIGVMGLAFGLLTAAPARADCTQTGNRVNCAPPGTGGFDAGLQDALTVKVQQGATVSAGAFDAGLRLNNNNVVSNNGTVRTGVAGVGIFVLNNNTVTNNSAVRTGNGGLGIVGFDNNAIINNGTVRTGHFGGGIVGFDNNTVINNATVRTGNAGLGIVVFDNNTVANNGTVRIGHFGSGIVAAEGNIILNTGLIRGGDASRGIFVDSGNLIINAGTIRVGQAGAGISVLTDNRVDNFGTILAGRNGVGVSLDGNNNVFNNFATVRSGVGGFSVEACPCAGFFNTVNNYGTLDGRLGIFGAGNTVNNNGLIIFTDPNTPIGSTHRVTNTVGGGSPANTFVQSARGTLALRMDKTGAIDRLRADAIRPGGRLRVVLQSVLYPDRIITNSAVGLTGHVPGGRIESGFDRYLSSSAFFTVTPIYTGGAGTEDDYTNLRLQIDRIAFNAIGGLKPNQQSLANALEANYSDTLTGDAETFYLNLFGAPTSAGVFNFLTGEGTAATQNAAFGANQLFQSTLFNQLTLWLGNPTSPAGAPLAYAAAPSGHEASAKLAAAAAPQPWQAWSAGFGGHQEFDGDAASGIAGGSQNSAGGVVGASYSPASDLVFGVAAGGSSTGFSVDPRATSGDVDAIHFGGYGAKTWNNLYLAGAVTYAHFDNRTERMISVGGISDKATGDFNSDLLSGRLEAGWRHNLGAYTITPFAAIEAARLWQDGYRESSTGINALTYQERDVTSLPASLGVQLDSRIVAQDFTLQSFLRLAWVHEFETTRRIEAAFVTLPGASFTAQGPSVVENVAKLTGGVKLGLSRSLAVFANLDGEFSGEGISYSGNGGLSWTW